MRPPQARFLYVLAHGAGAGMHHAFMTAIAEALATHDVATLRWEFPFMAARKPRPPQGGPSGQGGFGPQDAGRNRSVALRPDPAPVAEAAVRAVWTAARARYGELPMFAGGKSFGGRMTSRAHAAAPLEGMRGIAFLGFPLHPPEKPGPKVERAGFTPARGIERADHLGAAKGPLLFVQGTRDDLAELKLLRPVVKKLGARATLHVIDHADHGFDVLVRSGRRSNDVLAEIATTVAEWMDRVVRGTKPRRR